MLSGKGVTAEEYDRMPEEVCRRVEIVDGTIVVSPPDPPRHNCVARLLANAIEDAAPAPWQVTTGVDLRIRDIPLHNRRPDVLVFEGDPDELPVRPRQVLLAVEIMSRESVNADQLDKPVEYASAGIPHYWRIEQDDTELTAYTYVIDSARMTYVSAGAGSGALKVTHPFSITIDLDTLG